jgi:endo-1,3-1,4-beta-glycanase ExoK
MGPRNVAEESSVNTHRPILPSIVLVASTAAGISFASTARAVSSAEFYTPDGHGYGRFEARLMLPVGDGVVGTFFLWKNGSEVAGTYWNELDFEKIKANCTLQINSIYGLPSAQHTQIVNGVSDLCNAYHTYAYEWTPDHIAWSIDGREVRRDTGAGAKAYSDNAVDDGLQFRFNIWPGDPSFGGTFSASILPVQEYISWVQYSTYTPGAGDVACDFTLAWRESFEQGVPDSWAEGNWVSPKMLSTNSPSNVTVADGVAVLSLTADDMLGFTGTPPADDGDLPSVMGPLASDASASACDSGAAAASDSGASTASNPGKATDSGKGGGCSVSAPGAGGADGFAGAMMLAIGAALVRMSGRGRRARLG